MKKLTPFVIKKIEEKLGYSVTDKGACSKLRKLLFNPEAEDGLFALNTIKRWFGIIEKTVEPQQVGLEAIAQYLDYPSWVALTLESDYDKTEEKTEADYIAEFFPAFKDMDQAIQDYKHKKEQAKTKKEFKYCKGKIDELRSKQYNIKESIVQLCNLVTDANPYKTDLDKIIELYSDNKFEEADILLDEERLKDEQDALLLALKKKDCKTDDIEKRLNKNAHCFYIKAEIYEQFNELDEAEEFYLLSLKSIRVFDALYSLGEFYLIHRQDKERALIFFNEIRTRKDELLQIDEDNYNANLFFASEDMLSGYRIFINALFYIGRIYLELGDLEQGNMAMDKLIEIYSAIIGEDDDEDQIRDMLLRIADVYNELGNSLLDSDADNSAALLQKSLDIYEQYSVQDYAETIINLAYALIELPDYEGAKKLLDKAEKYFSVNSKNTSEADVELKSIFRLGVARTHYTFGYLYRRFEEYDSALKSLKRALAVFEKMYKTSPTEEIKNELIRTWKIMSLVYASMGNKEKSDEYAEKRKSYSIVKEI